MTFVVLPYYWGYISIRLAKIEFRAASVINKFSNKLTIEYIKYRHLSLSDIGYLVGFSNGARFLIARSNAGEITLLVFSF